MYFEYNSTKPILIFDKKPIINLGMFLVRDEKISKKKVTLTGLVTSMFLIATPIL